VARHLVEPATDMIIAYITANIATALAAVEADRNSVIDLGIPLPVPREYFIAKKYMALQPPSIFVVCDSIDFKKDRGANFIFATAKYGIAAIAEGQTTEIVTRETWRYQAALSQILDNLGLTNTGNTFKIKIIVRSAEFSEEYDTSSREGNPAQRWRKGVLLGCDVEFYEAL
jgi:hypothetical protein